MGNWKTVPLGSLGAEDRSAFATGPFGSAVSAKNFQKSGVPMIRGSNLSGDVGVRLDESDLVFVSDELVSRYARSIVTVGDLVFTCWGTIGQVGLMDESAGYERYIVSNKQMKMSPNHHRVSSLFLYYYLSQDSMVALMKGQSIGSSVPGFNLGQLKKLPVTLPPLIEQQAIADVLGAFDDKIAANNRLVKVADELAAALTVAASHGRTVQLATIAKVVMGSSPPGTSYNEKGEGVPFYQGVRDFGVRFPERRVWTTSPIRVATSGDTLVSVRAPVGRANLANEDMCIGRGIASLRSRDGHPYTLFHQVRLASDAWAPYEAEGTVFGSINKRQLEAIAVGCVGSGNDGVLEGRLAAVEQRIAAALIESRQLAKTRDGLLPLLMSGRVRVKDAEKVVEEVV